MIRFAPHSWPRPTRVFAVAAATLAPSFLLGTVHGQVPVEITRPTPSATVQSAQPSSVLVPAPPQPSGQPASQAAGQPTTSALPNAPSNLRALQDGTLQLPAGSGVIFTGSGTLPGPGRLPIEQPSAGPLPLTLDDAISLALARNVRLRYDRGTQGIVRGYQYQVANALLPNLTLKCSSAAEQLNLAAMGFRPQSLGGLLTQFGVSAASFPTIVKVNVTQAEVSMSQVLFNLPDFELYKGAKSEFKAVDLTVLNDRGEVVMAAAQAYLKILADQSSLSNATGQEAVASVTLSQAQARKEAGTGVNIDVLRAQVQLQQRQQDRISAEAQLDRDGIQLNRIMGIPAGQQLDLTDAAPYSALADMDPDHARRTAYSNRKDLLALQASIDVADRELRAVRYQRLPTVAFNGFYGVVGETTGLYHGAFTATGTVRVPIFREAGQRGEEQQVGAQLTSLRQREADLRVTVDAQIRSSLLDVESSRQLVEVAQSNVELATQELNDERERFAAGIDDNLPLVDAQSTLTGSQAQLVQSLYQYNVSKLALARATGVTESRYRAYLGK